MPRERPSLLADDDSARDLLRSGLTWYHRFALSENVIAPGRSDVERILSIADVPTDLSGKSVLDVGTIDGAMAISAERRGAERVVATEFRDDPRLAFSRVAEAVGSRVEHVHAEVYELPRLLPEVFDVVFFRGVLYHLRHPLAGIEAVRALAGGLVIVETALSTRETGTDFHPDAYRDDPTVWFIPSRDCVIDWLRVCGLAVESVHVWDQGPHERGLFTARAVDGAETVRSDSAGAGAPRVP